jgi:4-hydroxy-tetrahydrodipicolinate synthase
VLVLPPFYYKDVSDDGLYCTLAEVIERVGDARLRIYLYHIPPVAQIGYGLALIGRLLEDFGETIAGIKDSSGDWNNTKAILEAFPDFGTFAGSEVFLLATLRGGGRGCITATGNVNMAAMRRLVDIWRSPEAERQQEEISAVRRTIEAYPMIPALKAILAEFRREPSWSTVRPPLMNLKAAQTSALLGDLARRDFALAA